MTKRKLIPPAWSITALCLVIAVWTLPAFGQLGSEAAEVWGKPGMYDEPHLEPNRWHSPDHAPPDSPYWWPMVKGMAPEELYAAIQERKAELRAEAKIELAEKLEADPGSRPIAVFELDDRPELRPVWVVFQTFVIGVNRHGDEETMKKLVAFGMDRATAGHVLAAARDADIRFENLNRARGGEQGQRYMNAINTVYQKLSHDEYEALIDSNDFAEFSRLAGVPEEQIKADAEFVYRLLTAEAYLPVLVELRQLIGEDHWSILIHYLLTEEAPLGGSTAIVFTPRDVGFHEHQLQLSGSRTPTWIAKGVRVYVP